MKNRKKRNTELGMEVLLLSKEAKVSIAGGCCGGSGPPEDKNNGGS